MIERHILLRVYDKASSRRLRDEAAKIVDSYQDEDGGYLGLTALVAGYDRPVWWLRCSWRAAPDAPQVPAADICADIAARPVETLEFHS